MESWLKDADGAVRGNDETGLPIVPLKALDRTPTSLRLREAGAACTLSLDEAAGSLLIARAHLNQLRPFLAFEAEGAAQCVLETIQHMNFQPTQVRPRCIGWR
jgi:hypothetical protein